MTKQDVFNIGGYSVNNSQYPRIRQCEAYSNVVYSHFPTYTILCTLIKTDKLLSGKVRDVT